ncbi:MAG: hypothetical protein KatS3mg110_0944 [Pirellulaceae bacterium]|nr:MAG: hypothetical protein KatS3mg110_0944 [Pirellulaceae bacterium]
MGQVSVGQVENLEDLIRGLGAVLEALETTCRRQIEAAERQRAEAREEAQHSQDLLAQAIQAEQRAQEKLAQAVQQLESAMNALRAAQAALAACEARPTDENGDKPDCSGEEAAVEEAQAAVEISQAVLEAAQAEMEKATENRQRMEQRVERANLALSKAEQAFERVVQECTSRTEKVRNLIDMGKARLAAAQSALEAYLASNPPIARFYQWLRWRPTQGKPVTPDVIRERINLSRDQQELLQEYLYDRNPSYRSMVNKCRSEWAAAKGDVERNLINRKARIHLSGAFGEQLARFALAPLGARIETQGRTLVAHEGRYTRTDLIVHDLRNPVILGRGEGMAAPVGGSLAFEVKCGKPNYLYAQKDHMRFQTEGHKEADAHCTLCSRDIHDLPPEREKELREALRAAGSPLVGMMPAKNDIDQSCLAMIHRHKEHDLP